MEWEKSIFFLALLGVLFLLARFIIIVRKANLTDWGNPVLNFLEGLNRLFCEKYHRLNRLKIQLPEQEAAIVVANHYSGLDPMLLIASSRRPLRFLIAKEQYERFGLRWLFKAVGCIPVDRKGRPDIAMRAALNALSSNEVIAIFPHGKIHLPHHPQTSLKPGAARLAEKIGCSIYPVRLSGMLGQGHIFKSVVARGNAAIALCDVINSQDLSIEQINQLIENCIDQ